MSSEQISRHPVTFHPEDVQTDEPEHRVYLPDKIEKLGLEEGACVKLERMSEEIHGDRIVYLKGTREDSTRCEEHTKHVEGCPIDYKKVWTHGSTRLLLSINAHWVEDFIEYDGQDILIVEVNQAEDDGDQIRIYKNYDYNKYRKEQLEDQNITPLNGQPVIAAFAESLSLTDEFIDLASGTEFEGQRFEIVPIDGRYAPVRESDQLEYYRTIKLYPGYREVKQKGGRVPPIKVDRLNIFWAPDAEHDRRMHGEWEKDLPEEYSTEPSKHLYVDYSTIGTKVILPSKGVFLFETFLEDNRGRSWVRYTEPAGYWDSLYDEEKEGHIQINVPTPQEYEENGLNYWWDQS